MNLESMSTDWLCRPSGVLRRVVMKATKAMKVTRAMKAMKVTKGYPAREPLTTSRIKTKETKAMKETKVVRRRHLPLPTRMMVHQGLRMVTPSARQ
jgi:hypothetical protein